jgi:hypothetical protein
MKKSETITIKLPREQWIGLRAAATHLMDLEKKQPGYSITKASTPPRFVEGLHYAIDAIDVALSPT